jgi:hypothetical protein
MIIMEEITNFISSVGFPIGAYLLMFFYMKEQTKAHLEEVNELKSVINENTVMVNRLSQLIEDSMKD